LRKCATAVSAVPKFANGLVSRTAETAVARGMELFNRLLGKEEPCTIRNSGGGFRWLPLSSPSYCLWRIRSVMLRSWKRLG